MPGGNLVYWALIFLVVAIVSGLLGFVVMAAGPAQSAATLVFKVAIVLFLFSLVMNFVRR